MDGPHLQALYAALEAMGNSKPGLASALAIQPEELEQYLAGREIPPRIFLRALDIISRR